MLLASRPAASRSANAAAGVHSRPLVSRALVRGTGVRSGVVFNTAAWGCRGGSARRPAPGWGGGHVGGGAGGGVGAASVAGGVGGVSAALPPGGFRRALGRDGVAGLPR